MPENVRELSRLYLHVHVGDLEEATWEVFSREKVRVSAEPDESSFGGIVIVDLKSSP